MERFFYAELWGKRGYVKAYNNMSKRELESAIKAYQKQLSRGVYNTVVFGKTRDLYFMGKLGEKILADAIPYQADINYLIEQTEDWYANNLNEMEDVSNG